MYNITHETKRDSRSIRSSKSAGSIGTESHRVVEEGFKSSPGSKRSWFVTILSASLEVNSRRWWQESIEGKTSSSQALLSVLGVETTASGATSWRSTCFRVYRPTLDTPQDNQADIRKRLRIKIILILDRWSLHRAKILADFFLSKGIQVEWLPKYAPQLNPLE